MSGIQGGLISNTANLQKYLQLPQKGKLIAEYVWVDGSNGVRSKCKVCAFSISLLTASSASFSTATAELARHVSVFGGDAGPRAVVETCFFVRLSPKPCDKPTNAIIASHSPGQAEQTL